MDDYYIWLKNVLKCALPEHRRYSKLLLTLHSTPFRWTLYMDKNRMMDAYVLRDDFTQDSGNHILGPVSCLEVLVALSRRIEVEIMGEPGNDHYDRWFWIMMENLGVLLEDDIYDERFVSRKLDIWLDRLFDKNGNGSIFPLKKVTSDQREVDIWYQMQAYLNENYAF